jgi:hypothetical protein
MAMRHLRLLPSLALFFGFPFSALAQPEPPAEPPPPERVSVGEQGFLRPSALLQGWFFVSSRDARRDAREAAWQTTFRIRRAELRIKGEIVPDRVAYAVMIDPAKVLEPDVVEKPVQGGAGSVTVRESRGAVSVFQDFTITFLGEYADVSLGQLKIPLSWEGYNSSVRLLFPERALAAREFGDRRDIGLRVEKKLGPVYYHAGVFNGTGPNRPDDNNQKDAALRVEVFPLEGLMVGAVGYTSIGERDQPGTRDALEADLRVEFRAAIVQAEYIRHWAGSNQDDRTEGQGAYLAGGYTFLDRYQPVLRAGVLDDSVDLKDDHTWHYEAGFNYYIAKHEAKLQAAYGLLDRAKGPREHQVILAAQVAF